MSLIAKDAVTTRLGVWKQGHADGRLDGYRAGAEDTLVSVSERAPWWVRWWLKREGFYRAGR